MQSIVTKLRNAASNETECFVLQEHCQQAADEIENLEAQNAQLRADNYQLMTRTVRLEGLA